MAVQNVVPFGLEWDLWYRWFRYSWSQAGMGTAPVEMRDPGFEDHANVALIEWNHEIQALAASTSDPTLANGIRFGRFWRSL